MLHSKRQDYTAVKSEDNLTDDGLAKLGKRRPANSIVVSWMTVFILACSNIWLLFLKPDNTNCGSFASGWATDFVSARDEIEIEKVVFYGGPSFHENKTMYIPNPDPIKYVGDPSAEIDQNWDRLTWGRYIVISEAEAHISWGQDIDEYWDDERKGYVAGLDMFHTLHCLGNLRKALHPEHYGIKAKGPDHDLHQNHCIEQLRQYIMCSGDMTPVPTRFYSALGRNYVDSDRPHTCRNFEKLKHWMVNRYNDAPIVL